MSPGTSVARPLRSASAAWCALALLGALLAMPGAAAAQSGDPNKPAPPPSVKPVTDPAFGSDEPEEDTPDAPPPVREGLLAAPVTDQWDALLVRYLSEARLREGGVTTSFDYEALRRAEAESKLLTRVRAELLSVPPSRMGHADRLAWAINVYNFLVVEDIVRRIPPRGAPRWGGVLEIKTPEGGFFKTPLVEIEDLPYSLEDFERRFLFEEYRRRPGEKPPERLDPRVHFALVCGARGCPPLAPRAWRGGSLDRDLEAVTRRALESPMHLQWDEESNTLSASAIFEWYEADFGGRDRAFAFLMHYAPDAIRERVEITGVTGIQSTIPWDWALNDRGVAAGGR